MNFSPSFKHNTNMIKYISVIAEMSTDGIPKPLEIIWETGQHFSIDKILDIRKKASTKGGGAGLRFFVSIKGQNRYLFLKDDKWFIEL